MTADSAQVVSRKQAIAMLWQKGVLKWKLEPVQLDLYETYQNAILKTVVWLCSRRLGKSYALCVLAIETCLKKPNSLVKFLAPEQKQIKTITRPLFRQILEDCPAELRPKFSTQDNTFKFPNGSEIQLAGTDAGHAESLRGGSADLAIVDEAGFCSDLKYIIKSILIPTTTTTRGKIILSSTPPKTSDHEFNYYIKQAMFRGNLVKKTIYDNKRLTPEMIQEIIDELGGVENPDFQREYLCTLSRDEESTVVPEFTEAVRNQIVKIWPRPPKFDIYVSADIGFKDLTVVLFSYYDFSSAKIIVEDEICINGSKMTTEHLANLIKKKEADLYTHKGNGGQQQPYLRICDNNLIVINDLNQLHGITFLPSAKDDAAAALNNMRIMIAQGRIIINPRCKTLIHHLESANWNKTRTSFARSADAGHYDAIDALKYLARNVQMMKNPYPAGWNLGSSDNWHYSGQSAPLSQAHQQIKNIFTIKKAKR